VEPYQVDPQRIYQVTMTMFDPLLSKLLTSTSVQTWRADGVSFFKVAKDLYRIASLEYLGLNIPLASRPMHFAHCTYSDSGVKHCISNGPLCVDLITQLGLADLDPMDWESDDHPDVLAVGKEAQRAVTFRLRSRVDEIAIFGITTEMDQSEWKENRQPLLREIRVLANYFHGHVLRINGHNSDNDILISARELDCLKWTAAGKTAWEASVILGISERTVRFHLNAAREKLECATTTQAVAKAIANQLIDV
jgi:DNA-binding CsgD family transcriptional regulator